MDMPFPHHMVHFKLISKMDMSEEDIPFPHHMVHFKHCISD